MTRPPQTRATLTEDYTRSHFGPPQNRPLRGRLLCRSHQGSIGRTDFPRGNHAALIHSITTRLWPLGGDTAFVPGHGQMSNFAAERQSNPFVSDAALEASAT